MHLLLGNRRYSSWSLRGYLAVKFAGLEVEETVIPLFQEDTAAKIKAIAPDAPARVPVLVTDQGDAVWDTLSIFEYAAEKSRKGPLWPKDEAARARARSITAEMHSSFVPLRSVVPMNLARVDEFEPLPDDVQADVDRIVQIWTDCRAKYGSEGPFLFGKLSLADAAFAPVAVRFKSRSLPLPEVASAYIDALWALPDFVTWRELAEAEPWIIDQ
ncbi:glutathione S-transferase [Sneathiella limimaris]|uniref:glutathione S-transferase n=1 Tax=Sneathiella limimaris TaxID=1964213 RepID=UPI00146E105C|nr:glutathione S-transferase [Sneathiella limimaris]